LVAFVVFGLSGCGGSSDSSAAPTDIATVTPLASSSSSSSSSGATPLTCTLPLTFSPSTGQCTGTPGCIPPSVPDASGGCAAPPAATDTFTAAVAAGAVTLTWVTLNASNQCAVMAANQTSMQLGTWQPNLGSTGQNGSVTFAMPSESTTYELVCLNASTGQWVPDVAAEPEYYVILP
jgi:hypothetical protein